MFVVCGEALFDVFAGTDAGGQLTMDARIGGSPFNVAVGLARMTQPVSFLAAVGSGLLGQRLLAALRAEGVDTATTLELDAPTTLSLVAVGEGGVPAYAFYGHGCADRLLPPTALDAVPASARAFHFGSFAMLVEPTAGTQRALVEREQGRSLVAYDPNVRLNVVSDLDRWRDTLAWMAPRSQLVKTSDEDFALLFPGAAPETKAAEWLAGGSELVVLTRGAAGATAWTAAATASVPGRPVTLVDTVGAGDTFQAALLTWLAEHGRLAPGTLGGLDAAALAAALDFAGAAAAITCSRRGADLPRRAELP